MKINEILTEAVRQRLDPKCWKGKHKAGTKIKGGIRVNNCVPNEGVVEVSDKALKSYQQKVSSDSMKHKADPTKRSPDKANRSIAGFAKAHNRLEKGVAKELDEEFDLIETIIENLAKNNGVDAEAIWEDLESLSDDELYVFATTTTITESEAWQKANKKDKTDGMSQKAVNSYRREHPGSKLKTAVTTKPGKLKKGSKASKRRKSYCSRSRGQMKMHSISCAKTPDKAICKARRRWNC